MNKISSSLVFFGYLLICSSCEGNRIAHGYIVDQQTFLPIDSVYVEVLTGTDTIYSDSTGHYYVSNPFGKCIPDCTDIRIKYSKSRYQTFVKENPEEGEVIFLYPDN